MTGFFLMNEEQQRAQVSLGKFESGEEYVALELKDGDNRIKIKISDTNDIEELAESLKNFAWDIERRLKKQTEAIEPSQSDEYPETPVERF